MELSQPVKKTLEEQLEDIRLHNLNQMVVKLFKLWNSYVLSECPRCSEVFLKLDFELCGSCLDAMNNKKMGH